MSLMGVKPKPSQRKVSHGLKKNQNDQIKVTIAKRLKSSRKRCDVNTFNEVDMHK